LLLLRSGITAIEAKNMLIEIRGAAWGVEGLRRVTLNLRRDVPELSSKAVTVLCVRLTRSVPVVLVQLPESRTFEKDDSISLGVIEEAVGVELPTRPLTNTTGLHAA